ncbi:sodium solute symporter [Aureococcus anophagefferens]|nr:sodium solute symporter [Aureococcus anophagefferens]
MIYTIYVSKFSSDLIWEMLKKTTSYSVSDCKHIFSEDFDGFSSPSFNPDAADPADIFPELFLYAEEDGDLTDCLEDDPPPRARSSSPAAASTATRASTRTAARTSR